MAVMTEDVAAVEEPRARRNVTKDLWFLLAVAIALALVMKAFLVQAFFIPSGSMEKTLHGCPGCRGDRVLVNKLVYRFRDIHRGEIVVFNGKGTNFNSEVTVDPPRNVVQKVLREVQGAVGFGAPGDKDFIKRVIGIPGDTVACCTNDHVTVNGQELREPYVYLTDPQTPQMSFQPVTVPPGQLWVMGDHRDGSADSRFNGTIPETAVVGRAFAVFFPPGRSKVLRVPDAFDQRTYRTSSLPASPAAPPVLGLALAVPVTAVRRWRSGRRAPSRHSTD
ncbi:MAG TPA: signal peptidase I [Mycobacteriales bacterium]|jgi:signal peptidase I|nr:signal peptidase I [Mycobacteriales bacterium]